MTARTRTTTSRRFALTTFAAVLITASTASAASMRLSDLIDSDQSIPSGDKVFQNFTYSATGDSPAAEDINVIPITDNDGNYGIRFQGGFIDHIGDGASIANISFDAAVAEGAGMLISDAHLAMNGAVIGGSGFVSVTETFINSVIPEASIMTVNGGPDADFPPKFSDWIDFDEPFDLVHVRKVIVLESGRGVATLSLIDQTFSQVPVPEPSAGLISLAGLFAWMSIRRRHRDF